MAPALLTRRSWAAGVWPDGGTALRGWQPLQIDACRPDPGRLRKTSGRADGLPACRASVVHPGTAASTRRGANRPRLEGEAGRARPAAGRCACPHWRLGRTAVPGRARQDGGRNRGAARQRRREATRARRRPQRVAGRGAWCGSAPGCRGSRGRRAGGQGGSGAASRASTSSAQRVRRRQRPPVQPAAPSLGAMAGRGTPRRRAPAVAAPGRARIGRPGDDRGARCWALARDVVGPALPR